MSPAEKVDGFPRRRGSGGGEAKYPWQQIAEDGGVWRLDPADYDVKTPRAISNAASQWASRHNRKAVTQTADGRLFIQFTTLGGRQS